MSLTSYRAAPPRGKMLGAEHHNGQTAGFAAEARRCRKSSRRGKCALRRPGNGLLSQVLRHSTIGAKAFDGRVRDGIGSGHSAKVTRPAKGGRKQTGPTRNSGDMGFYDRLLSSCHGTRARTHGHRLMRAFKPIERLVPVSCTHCCASTPGLSTWSSSTALKGELV
jgi:hypothetical protein